MGGAGVGWVTAIRAPEQVDYRLTAQCGCDAEHEELEPAGVDRQVDYRLAAGDLVWIGSGLSEVGITPGTPVDAAAARALMDGVHPGTGERLVTRKKAVDPRAKLPARPLLDAVTAACETVDATPEELLGERLAARVARAERGVVRDGEAHRIPIGDIERLAAAAGVDLAVVYEDQELADARANRGRRIDVGLRGVDVTLDLPKSISVAYALADPATAAAIEAAWMESVREAVGALEEWTAYGMTGHHGDGRRAERIGTSGLLGWTTVHRSARPVPVPAGGDPALREALAPGDPHLHVHVTLAHLARCEDGRWRTIAAGAEDLHRHARVVNELAEGRLRALLGERLGARFTRDPESGVWELAGISEELRETYSRRHHQVVAAAGESATPAQAKAAAARTAQSKPEVAPGDVRRAWRARGQAVVGDVDEVVAAALPGPPPPPAVGAGIDGGPRVPSPGEIAAQIWTDEEHGLVASRKTVSHPQVMAAVAAAVPALESREHLERLVDEVLAVPGHAVRLPDSSRAHESHPARYTHTSILGAETALQDAATAGVGAGLAQLTPDAAELAIETAEAAQGWTWSAQQRAVLARLLTTGHAVDAVIGVAGAGKTTLMNAARAGWAAAGLRVAGASTAAVAAANLAAEAGIISATVAAWTRAITGGAGLDDVDVLVVDEASMVDDRALAALATHATTTGTKLVLIGDPQQLQAVGVGGGFARAHELVGGLELSENRRQRDLVERAALADWRTGARTTALARLADHGHVHATTTATEALAGMVAAWDTARQEWADPHDLVDELLLLAPRRADVDALNAAAQARRRAAGELGPARTWALGRTAGGGHLTLAVGDLVRVTRNDYRSRQPGGGGGPDVLNGYRGIVREVDARRGARVEWRRRTPDGPTTEAAWIAPRQLAAGHLTLGYAMTAASAQGLTSEVALVYGAHADAHTLYPELTRARRASHLFLPLAEAEDAAAAARLGTPRTGEELLQRAVTAYGRTLARDTGDSMVTDEMVAAVSEAAPPMAMPADDAHEPTVRADEDQALRAAAARAISLPRSRTAPVGEQDQEEGMLPHWRRRPHGAMPTAHLPRAAATATEQADRADQLAAAATDRARTLATTAGTDQAPAAHQLAAATTQLQTLEALVDAAAAAARAADQHAHQAALYRARLEPITRRLTRRRSALLRQRGELREVADWLTHQITAADQHTAQARAAAADHDRQARAAARDLLDPLRPVGPLTPETVSALHGRLPVLREALEAADAQQVADHQQRAAHLRQVAAGHRATADALRREYDARRRLAVDDPARATVEDTQRRRAADDLARQRQEQLHRVQTRPPLQPPPQRRDGPSIGL
ncbi:conjugative relaxase domain-containing protein, TrwC/TraI family [Streptomyces zhaozhouensis]|uniref:Conjugative relaxase domain-containing protein, TrwC/TraI family n=1 Tax=Streptomyces zhaozhouensis TaxID=1300267 RepID=A0A286E950_9ACTN|nr:conjugative relaxase domain-containing protein, TrwC/TraI family [Streptomyces zhaozhouensis]